MELLDLFFHSFLMGRISFEPWESPSHGGFSELPKADPFKLGESRILN